MTENQIDLALGVGWPSGPLCGVRTGQRTGNVDLVNKV